MFTIKSEGNFDNTDNFLKNMLKSDVFRSLESYGKAGVAALSSATPAESGATGNAWGYVITQRGTSYSIAWTNSNVTSGGVPVAIMLQYGHGTGTGGFVQGRDFINPAIKPIMDKIANQVWKAVTSA